jgi:polyphosphate kinase
MHRNLERRVEIMFPVQDEKIRDELLDVINGYFMDTCQAKVLDSAGTWKQISPSQGEKPFRVQKDMLSRAARNSDSPAQVKQEFIVRRA